MPEGTGLVDFSVKYPDHFFDVGIAEQHGVTFAAGVALEGLRPVVAIYSTFLQRAYDQILHDICIDKIPVVFAIDRGGLVGEDGPTHHGLFDYAYLRSIPNIVVMAPKDENEFTHMLKTAIEYNEGPIAVRYPRGAGEGVVIDPEMKVIEIGTGEVLADGDDILLLAVGSSVPQAIAAQKELEKENISAAVINARFIKPLDTALITQYAKKTGRIITIEEHVKDGGFGSAVLECLSDNEIFDIKLKRIGITDTFVEHGSQNELRKKYKIDATEIISEALKLMKK
jgi:1-deoxy-D-xylulose-5-phosphate synthase